MRTYRALLGNRLLARLLAGEFVSAIGDWLYLVALLILVYERPDASPLLLGVVGAARVLPYVFLSVPAGIVADRYDRRLVLLVTDLARGAIMLLMAALAAVDGPLLRDRGAGHPGHLFLGVLRAGHRRLPAPPGA